MKYMQIEELRREAKIALKKCLYITGTIRKLSQLSGLSKATLHRIATGRHKGTRATRARLEIFFDQNINRVGRPYGVSKE